MKKQNTIEEVFEMMGLSSNEDRKRYTFDALYQNPQDSWELKMAISGNTDDTREGAKRNAELEHNLK